MRVGKSSLVLLPVVLWLGSAAGSAPPARVAIFSVALNDLANQPASPALPERMRLLGVALRDRLGTDCGYQIASIDSVAEASAELPASYLYDHPEEAVALAAPLRVEWVVLPRLNRASPWVTDLQAHVVRVRDSAIVSNRIVELKGMELTPELAARLIERGGAWMADQISQAIESAAGSRRPVPRRCPA